MGEYKVLSMETISVDIKPGEALLIINKKRKLSVHSKVTFEGENIIDIAEGNAKRINDKFMSLIKVYLTSLNPIRTIGAQCSEVISKYTGLSLKEAENKLADTLTNLLCPLCSSTETMLRSFPFKLEAYEKQRLMFAVAFLIKPKLIVLDDLIFKIQPEIKSYVLEQFKKLKEENNTSIILISKKLDAANEAIDNIAIMYKGTIVEYGNKDLILKDPVHPYTRQLLDSKYTLSSVETPSKIIDYVEDIKNLPRTGCSFCLKCKKASYDCIYMAPKVKTIGNGRQVICEAVNRLA